MNILVTGAKGFVGKNLVENLKNIRDGKNRTRPDISIDSIYEYDIDSTPTELDEYCRDRKNQEKIYSIPFRCFDVER